MNIINKIKPIKVLLKRGSSTESVHNAHAVVCDIKGRKLMGCGNSGFETFIRSSLKPFQALPFITSGALEKLKIGDKALAIACSSHQGSSQQAREAFKIIWTSVNEVKDLQCPIPKGRVSKLQHNCSGKHAAFLATCRKMDWPISTYLSKNHPIQKEICRRIGEILEIPPEELIAARDDCGAPTFLLEINQMAHLYASLCGSNNPDFEQIVRAMIKHPSLISGEGGFDTELMKRSHGQIISKGGSEGVQCIGRVGEGLGLAIKVEDGSKRAKHAVAIHLLKQLEWVTPTGLKEVEESVFRLSPGVELEVIGGLNFQENEIQA